MHSYRNGHSLIASCLEIERQIRRAKYCGLHIQSPTDEAYKFSRPIHKEQLDHERR